MPSYSFNVNVSSPAGFNMSMTNALVSEPGESAIFRGIKLFLYSTLFVVSVVGNTLVFVVIIRRHQMRTVTNYFILNLAAADLAVTCICIPFDIPVQENNYKWPYGKFFCKLLYPMQTMTMFASIFTLTTLSLSRFWAIVYPLRTQIAYIHAFIFIVLVWIVSAILTVPYIIVLGLNETKMECVETWSNVEYRKAYTLSLFLTQYLLPLIIITTAYAKIGNELKGRNRRKNSTKYNLSLQAIHQKETRRVLRMLMVVTLLFAICVLPNNVMWLWLDFGNGGSYKHFWKMVTVTNIILFANSAANPVAYTICHENFREELKIYCSFFTKCFCSRTEIPTTCPLYVLKKINNRSKNGEQRESPGRLGSPYSGDVENLEKT